jgi:HSP20 family protein
MSNAVLNNDQTHQVAQPDNRSRGFLYPHVNIVETKDSWVLEAEMPGVNKEGLELLLEENTLTIIGRRQPSPVTATLMYRESSNRDFKRVFELAPTIDTSRISARMDNGILHLELPKAEKVKPRRISVE